MLRIDREREAAVIKEQGNSGILRESAPKKEEA
jgi:hypothetical protein